MEGMGSLNPKRPLSLMASASSKPPLAATATSPFRLRPKPQYPPNPSQHQHNRPDFAHNRPDFAHNNAAFPAHPAVHHPQHQQQEEQQPSQVVADTLDARKLKRVVSNRVSAQRSRLRKLQRLATLERQSSMLEAQIGLLRPQVAAYGEQKQLLIMEKRALTHKLAALDKEKIVEEAEIARKQAEVQMLRELEKKQKEVQAAQAMGYFDWDSTDWNNQFGPQQMVYTDPPEGTSETEVDEQNVNLNNSGAMSELEAIVNPSILSKEESNP